MIYYYEVGPKVNNERQLHTVECETQQRAIELVRALEVDAESIVIWDVPGHGIHGESPVYTWHRDNIGTPA